MLWQHGGDEKRDPEVNPSPCPISNSEKCGEHSPGIAEWPHFAALFFSPCHRDFEPIGTVALEGGKQFGIEGQAIFRKPMGDGPVILGLENLDAALGIFALQIEQQMHRQQKSAVRERAPRTLDHVGGGGPLANADHRTAFCDRGFEEF